MTDSDEARRPGPGAAGSPRPAGQGFAPGLSRRRFLQYTGLGAASAVTAGCSGGPRAGPATASRPAASTALPETLSGTIADVKHVVILMQENRSFDHYFGTLRGVRGFGDTRAVSLPTGNPVWYQPLTEGATAGAGYVLPFRPTAPNLGLQFLQDLAHDWDTTHTAWNGGLYDQWLPAKGTTTMAYMTRD